MLSQLCLQIAIAQNKHPSAGSDATLHLKVHPSVFLPDQIHHPLMDHPLNQSTSQTPRAIKKSNEIFCSLEKR